jgi:hypothetical protein
MKPSFNKSLLTLAATLVAATLAAFLLASCASTPPTHEPPANTDTTAADTAAETDTEAATEEHVHAYGEWTVSREPTCTAAGIRERVCSCGKKSIESIPKLSHTPVTRLPAAEPTVTENGRTEEIACAVCNKVLEKSTVIPYVGHTDLAYEVYGDGKRCAITGRGSCTAAEVYVPATIDGYTVERIEERAFFGDTTLTGIRFPETLQSIGGEAFVRCTALTEVTIPASTLELEPFCFELCTGMTSVTLRGHYIYIYAGAFMNCTALTDVYFAGTDAQWSQLYILQGNEAFTSATVHPNTKPTDPRGEDSLSETEAMEIASDYWNVKTGDTDPDNGFLYRIESQGVKQTPEGRTVYNIFLRWFVELPGDSHYSTVENIWVDAVTGEVAYPG